MPNRPVSQLVENQAILTASADMSVAEAAAAMRDSRVGAIMVVDDGVPIGMVSARDALRPEMEQFEAELKEREHIEEILG